MTSVNMSLLKWQREVLSDSSRFKIVCAGRRCGKSRLAASMLLIYGLKCSNGSAVMYVAPTNGQARVIIWDLLMDLGREVIQSAHINNLEITLINGIKIYVRGADRPDTLRGVSLTFVVLDEYADMKPVVWEQIIRAALSDKKGDALFIGTPKGRNHFYDIYQYGVEDTEQYDPEYKSWSFTTEDNELIDPSEIEAARRTLSSFAFKQEYLASFSNSGTDTFKEEWIKYGNEPKGGSYFMACDLAGFEDVAVANTARKKRLDNSAFAIVKVTDDGKWFVRKIEYGRWDVRETAVRILKNVREFRPTMVGIEKGTTFNAVMPYLTDLMRKNGVYFHVHPLTHNNQKKTDRVVWALQGLFEHGRVTLNGENRNDRNSWQSVFLDEYLMFPTKDVHDDLIESLAYVNQMAITTYADPNDYDDEPEVLEVVCGF
jgi:phage terminase large subunit-like protein